MAHYDDLVLHPKGRPDSAAPGGVEVRAAAVIVAAGNSTRMARAQGGKRKPQMELLGLPILEHTCAIFNAIPDIKEIVLVAHPDDIATFEQWTLDKPALDKVRAIVPGGKERADSVRSGVFWCGFDMQVILVHDAARPLVRPDVVRNAILTAYREGAALVAIPVTDTIKEADYNKRTGSRALRTVDRSRLWAAQTPQVFDAVALRTMVADAAEEGFAPTDDAGLWERFHGPVPIVMGHSTNLKITTPTDLEIAAAILRARASGHDEGAA